MYPSKLLKIIPLGVSSDSFLLRSNSFSNSYSTSPRAEDSHGCLFVQSTSRLSDYKFSNSKNYKQNELGAEHARIQSSRCAGRTSVSIRSSVYAAFSRPEQA